jgi:capsular polysaccharide biosynthesis protein
VEVTVSVCYTQIGELLLIVLIGGVMDTRAYSRVYEVVRDGFVTPGRIENCVLGGCVYRGDGSKVDLSERFSGHRGDFAVNDNPDRVDAPSGARRLPGRGVYLGHQMAGHYGHFVFESLAMCWIFDELRAEEFDYFLVHPFFFGSRVADYALYAFKRLGIDPGKIVLVGDAPLAFDELVVPERLSRLNHSSDPSLRSVYARVSGVDTRREPPFRRLYISRRQFNTARFKRVVANEVQIENLFRLAGFEVICPEQITYPQQIEYCATASVIAGMSGSNLFNVLFAPAGTRLIELGDPRYAGLPNPCIAPSIAVSRARGHFIPFQGRQFGPRLTMLFDVDYVARSVDAALADDPAHVPMAAIRQGLDLRAFCEVSYRCFRPTVGHVAREFANRLRRPAGMITGG